MRANTRAADRGRVLRVTIDALTACTAEFFAALNFAADIGRSRREYPPINLDWSRIAESLVAMSLDSVAGSRR
jgi:hypothetical protein